jgi:hypothetical protein
VSESDGKIVIVGLSHSCCANLTAATRIQLLIGGSSFSTMYCVMKLPPSLTGGFHVSITES